MNVRQMQVSVGLLAALVFGAVSTAHAARIYWDDGDSRTGIVDSARWVDLQTAITNAEVGTGTVGTVKLSGDFQRVRDNTTNASLSITGGWIDMSGGWSSDFLTQNGKSTLDVNADGSANNAYRVLQITGTNVALSFLLVTGGWVPETYTADAGGILIGNRSGPISSACTVRLSDLVISNNAASHMASLAGGVYVVYTDDVVIRRCDVVNNRSPGYGGGIAIADYVGDFVNIPVIDSCTIRGNEARNYSGGGLWLGGDSGKGALVANCKITGNRAGTSGAGVRIGSYGWPASTKTVLFNCLIQGNRQYGTGTTATNSTGMGIRKGQRDIAYVVNCTVVDNINTLNPAASGVLVEAGFAGDSRLRFVNSIVSSNNGVSVYQGPPDAASLHLQRTIINETSFRQGTTTYGSLAEALAASNSVYHSVNDAGALTQDLAGNLEGDPGFLGKEGRPYWLTRSSPCLNNALTRTGGSGDSIYTYVDVNGNGSYDALMDIVVAGTAPAGDHFVCKYDLTAFDRALAGEDPARIKPNRVLERRLDRGAYEFAPPAGTVVMVR